MRVDSLRSLDSEHIEDTLEYIKVTEQDQFDYSNITECNHCYFEKATLTDLHFQNISCYDVVFKNCDFSNVVWNTDCLLYTSYAIRTCYCYDCRRGKCC